MRLRTTKTKVKASLACPDRFALLVASLIQEQTKIRADNRSAGLRVQGSQLFKPSKKKPDIWVSTCDSQILQELLPRITTSIIGTLFLAVQMDQEATLLRGRLITPMDKRTKESWVSVELEYLKSKLNHVFSPWFLLLADAIYRKHSWDQEFRETLFKLGEGFATMLDLYLTTHKFKLEKEFQIQVLRDLWEHWEFENDTVVLPHSEQAAEDVPRQIHVFRTMLNGIQSLKKKEAVSGN